MVFLWIKSSLQGKGVFFKAGDVFLMEKKGGKIMLEIMKSKKLDKCIDFLDLNDTFRPFVAGDKETMMIIRSGGIGDLLSLSALRHVAQKNHMMFITQDGYLPVFDWWENPPQQIVDVAKPLFSSMNSMEWVRKKKNIKRFVCEGLVEGGDRQNWHEIFFASIGASVPVTYCRPKLLKKRICEDPSNIYPDIPSILICPKASAAMRSMAFEPIYRALNYIIGDKDVNIYLHELNATDQDRAFIAAINDPRIKLIQAKGIKEYLLDIFDSSMVISVDSAAIHFREGIEKPAIGIYSSFTTESRTKHYNVTYSFDIESKCRFRPCFLHERERGEVCREALPGSQVAPCLSEGYNPGLFDQLVENMNDYLTQNL